MYIRFHRNQHVDCIVSTSIGTVPDAPPGDVVVYINGDVNPTKTVSESRNIQAVDPLTGQPLFNADGTPKWKTTNALDVNGNPIPVLDANGQPEVDVNGKPVYQQVIVTQMVDVTYSLMDNPTIFTPDDVAKVTSYTVVGSLDHAKQIKIAELEQTFANVLLGGFSSNPDGTGARTFGFSPLDQQHWDLVRGMITAGTCPNPIQVKDINGNRIRLTPDQAKTLCNDAQNFYLNNYGHWDSKEQAIQNAEAEADIDAITW